MTFGESMRWGADKATSARLLDIYAGADGNFLDTANRYSEGNSETILGELLQRSKSRMRSTSHLSPG